MARAVLVVQVALEFIGCSCGGENDVPFPFQVQCGICLHGGGCGSRSPPYVRETCSALKPGRGTRPGEKENDVSWSYMLSLAGLHRASPPFGRQTMVGVES